MTTSSPPLPAPSLEEATTGRRLPAILKPALPRLAAMCADDLTRPMRHCHDGLRAVEQWFVQHGDPFAPLEAEAFTKVAKARQDHLDHECAGLGNAELLAHMSAAFGALKTRLDAAQRDAQS